MLASMVNVLSALLLVVVVPVAVLGFVIGLDRHQYDEESWGPREPRE